MEDATDEETYNLLLQLKELRCARLQAMIALKEARLEEAKLREARLRSPSSPSRHDEADASAGDAADEHPTEPPMLRRMSSSLVNVEVAGQNTRPLGRLQPEGRTHYRPAPSTRFGARSHFPGADRLRGGLLPSGIPTSLVQRWHAGSISGDLALREILDAVCRVRSGRDASPEERELAAMTQSFTADGMLSLGGPLGALVGGLPDAKLITAVGQASSSNLAPLHALLLREPEAVCCDALRQFTRQLLTSAESEGCSPDATDKELAAAYRDAARRKHPDRGGDKVAFQKLQQAYEEVTKARKAAAKAKARGQSLDEDDEDEGKENAATNASTKPKGADAGQGGGAHDDAAAGEGAEGDGVKSEGDGVKSEGEDVSEGEADDATEAIREAQEQLRQQREARSRRREERREGLVDEDSDDEAAEAEEGELDEGEILSPKSAEAAAAAQREARAALAATDDLIEEMPCEEMCNVAEQAR
ncbi:hypothetical protein Ctob_012522 [Chrysochromulina tobinii]|uniref:J domain-containing protein n=1 Tax=Chrysochromulina tobinii TaxID=1460289 RepID=A0A0M0K6N2_9EUKA|nr:hypothetical protein Ctob_012522 [Chrysochromulina tobinii]|eukprot:KOO34048.1 hypothetical protein Ctob_012522 [Chrysochromulina sp. CCMP291]